MEELYFWFWLIRVTMLTTGGKDQQHISKFQVTHPAHLIVWPAATMHDQLRSMALFAATSTNLKEKQKMEKKNKRFLQNTYSNKNVVRS